MNKESQWLLDEKYGGVESEAFKADLGRLATGEPLGYVIGWVPFLHTKIFLDSKPLIPRPETEFWVNEAIFQLMKNKNSTSRPEVLDLCAGSGCVGVAVLKALPNTSVDFAEINKDHHETIRKNVQENGIEKSRANIFGGDLFENVTKTYDLILTNPPYINPTLEARVQSEVIRFEPQEALFGGANGTELIENILKNAPSFLKPGGILYIEHEPEQEVFMKKLLPGLESHQDQFGIVRFSTYKKRPS